MVKDYRRITKYVIALLASVLMVVLMLSAVGIGMSYADDLGGLGGGSGYSNDWNNSGNVGGGTGTPDSGVPGLNWNNDDDGNGLTNLFNNTTPTTDESIAQAQNVAAPILRIFSMIVSVILVLLASWIFVQTALDFVYLQVPVLRNALNPVGGQSMSAGGGMGMGMGGMGMGMGMGGGMGAQSSGTGGRKWVSDEAEQALMESMASSVGSSNGMMGGGMMGGMMGGMGGQQQARPKGVIGLYLKKRLKAYVLFTIAVLLLFCTVPISLSTSAANTFLDFLRGFLPN